MTDGIGGSVSDGESSKSSKGCITVKKGVVSNGEQVESSQNSGNVQTDDSSWRREATLDDALELGLKEAEFHGIVEAVGRPLNMVEIGIASALYSEHCSYKSTKVHLRNLPSEGERVLQGPGENAGVVSIGDGLGVAFKVESHNHPSFIEPFQGAATGVGGILRDVFTMGARPLALLNALRFGEPTNDHSRYLLKNAVRGIGTYGNCMGIPTIGGELYFHPRFSGNCLVNAFALGVVEADKIFLGEASGVGNKVYYVGSKTGRDGIHGASMASEEFDESSAEKRPTVQVGDPFQEKLLLEACLEIMKEGTVVGIQDMGAAGMTSSSFEMAERAGTGVRLHLDRVPMRETGMNPFEIMLSESQERMLLVVEPGKEEKVEAIFKKWGLDAVCIGEVTEESDVQLYWHGECISSLAASVVTSSVPSYRWPEEEPTTYKERLAFKPEELEVPGDLSEVWLNLLGSPNLCSRYQVYEQYDSTVRGNTSVAPGGDAGVIRIKLEEERTDKGVAISLDCNSLYCEIDPYQGAVLSVIGAYRNVTAVGAVPIGMSDCLNYGSPEKPEGMWQIAQGIRGIGDSARALNVPIVSGNVSLYNETQGAGILPTPMIALVGLLEDHTVAVGAHFRDVGDKVLLFGTSQGISLGGSEYLSRHFSVEKGALPEVDYGLEEKVGNIVRELAEARLLKSSHDIGEGGFAVALAESCYRDYQQPMSVKAKLVNPSERADLDLFGEGGPRYLVSCSAENENAVRKKIAAAGFELLAEGEVTDSGSIEIDGVATIDSAKGCENYRDGLQIAFH